MDELLNKVQSRLKIQLPSVDNDPIYELYEKNVSMQTKVEFLQDFFDKKAENYIERFKNFFEKKNLAKWSLLS